MLPSKLNLVYCHNSREIRKHLLCKVEVYYFKVTTILGRACDVASEYGTFLLVIRMNLVIRNGPSTYVIEKTSFVKIKVDTRVARELSYSPLPRTSSGDKNWRRY